MIRLSFLALGLTLILPLTTPDAIADLTVGFETNGVRVTGVTHGGKIVAASIDRPPSREVISTTGVLTDSDNDGEVFIAMKEGIEISDRAIYAVVDVASGHYIVVNKAEGVINTQGLQAQGVKANSIGEFDRFVVDDTGVQTLIVRPGRGAWAMRGADGETGDADQVQDGKLEIQLEDTPPLKSFPPAPRLFANDDLVITMNPFTMEVSVTKVTGVSTGVTQ
ncbi:MAG: hypothetical protein DMF56_19725 [Acidobacteria bacterium]|nr:MAG: hypothetical protein DMF56_19725 [Acidobacteriota bacterium]